MPMAYPMFAYVIYILFLGLLNFRMRRKMAIERKIRFSYLKVYQGEAPEEMVVMARHFDNQFQLPMVFLITCLSSQIFIGYNLVNFVLAFVFILSRFAHSYIHLTSNNVIHRALAYFFGFLVLLVMWVNMLIMMA